MGFPWPPGSARAIYLKSRNLHLPNVRTDLLEHKARYSRRQPLFEPQTMPGQVFRVSRLKESLLQKICLTTLASGCRLYPERDNEKFW